MSNPESDLAAKESREIPGQYSVEQLAWCFLDEEGNVRDREKLEFNEEKAKKMGIDVQSFPRNRFLLLYTTPPDSSYEIRYSTDDKGNTVKEEVGEQFKYTDQHGARRHGRKRYSVPIPEDHIEIDGIYYDSVPTFPGAIMFNNNYDKVLLYDTITEKPISLIPSEYQKICEQRSERCGALRNRIEENEIQSLSGLERLFLFCIRKTDEIMGKIKKGEQVNIGGMEGYMEYKLQLDIASASLDISNEKLWFFLQAVNGQVNKKISFTNFEQVFTFVQSNDIPDYTIYHDVYLNDRIETRKDNKFFSYTLSTFFTTFPITSQNLKMANNWASSRLQELKNLDRRDLEYVNLAAGIELPQVKKEDPQEYIDCMNIVIAYSGRISQIKAFLEKENKNSYESYDELRKDIEERMNIITPLEEDPPEIWEEYLFQTGEFDRYNTRYMFAQYSNQSIDIFTLGEIFIFLKNTLEYRDLEELRPIVNIMKDIPITSSNYQSIKSGIIKGLNTVDGAVSVTDGIQFVVYLSQQNIDDSKGENSIVIFTKEFFEERGYSLKE